VIPKNNLVLTSNGAFDGSTPADLQAFFADVAGSGNDHPIVIHFHGGLVDDARGRLIAETLYTRYQGAGAYPLFFVWRAGLFEVIRNNFREIASEDLFPILVERVAQYLTGMLKGEKGERGEQVEMPGRNQVRKELKRRDGTEPYAEEFPDPELDDDQLSAVQEAQFKALLEGDTRLPEAVQEAAGHDLDTFNPEIREDLKVVRTQEKEGERAIISTAAAVAAGVRIIGRCILRFARGHAHGFYPTIVEEVARELKGDWLANTVWKRMKGDTADAFTGTAQTHGGTALLAELKKLRAAGDTRRIVLVGHSTGAVFISELLRAAQRDLPPDLRFEVIFLAPACTFGHFSKTLGDAAGRISGFRSFAMTDALEQADKLIPVLYPRSLLYFVSGLCEGTEDMPIVGMQRFHSGAAPFDPNDPDNDDIRTVVDRFGANTDAWIWSQSDTADGMRSKSIRHGDFDNDDTTLQSVGHIIAHGF